MASIDIGLPQSDPHWEGGLGMHEVALDPALQMTVRMSFVDRV